MQDSNGFHVIGLKEFDNGLLQNTIGKLLFKEHDQIRKGERTHSNIKVPILMYHSSTDEDLEEDTSGYSHYYYLNDGSKQILDDYKIAYNLIAQIPENDLPRSSLLISNVRFF